MNESLKLALCEMQAALFVQSREKGYASEPFIKAFMQSDIAEDLDKPFHHMQWAGTHYLMSRMEEEHADSGIGCSDDRPHCGGRGCGKTELCGQGACGKLHRCGSKKHNRRN